MFQFEDCLENVCSRQGHICLYESETCESQMYGHNAGQPVSSLYTTKYYHT